MTIGKKELPPQTSKMPVTRRACGSAGGLARSWRRLVVWMYLLPRRLPMHVALTAVNAICRAVPAAACVGGRPEPCAYGRRVRRAGPRFRAPLRTGPPPLVDAGAWATSMLGDPPPTPQTAVDARGPSRAPHLQRSGLAPQAASRRRSGVRWNADAACTASQVDVGRLPASVIPHVECAGIRLVGTPAACEPRRGPQRSSEVLPCSPRPGGTNGGGLER